MNKHLRYVIPTVVVALIAATTIAFVRASDGATNSAGAGPSPCKLEMTRALYGFQCRWQGFFRRFWNVQFQQWLSVHPRCWKWHIAAGVLRSRRLHDQRNSSTRRGYCAATANLLRFHGDPWRRRDSRRGSCAGRNYRRCGAAFSVPSGAGEVKLQRIVEADPGRRATGSGSQPNPIDSGLLPPQRRTPIVIQESGCRSPRELSPSIVSW